MLHKIKSTVSSKVYVNFKHLKFTTTKFRLVLGIILVAVLIKYLFTMSCTWHTAVFSGSTKPIYIDSDIVKVGAHERNLDNMRHKGDKVDGKSEANHNQ